MLIISFDNYEKLQILLLLLSLRKKIHEKLFCIRHQRSQITIDTWHYVLLAITLSDFQWTYVMNKKMFWRNCRKKFIFQSFLDFRNCFVSWAGQLWNDLIGWGLTDFDFRSGFWLLKKRKNLKGHQSMTSQFWVSPPSLYILSRGKIIIGRHVCFWKLKIRE